MLQPATRESRMQSAWRAIAGRYAAYQLVLPGSAEFICQADRCNAHCCRAFSVSLGDRDVERLAAASGLQPVAFLEAVDGEPIRLPLARPYLLRRENNRCAQLAADLSCGQYDGRPDACRLYPYFLLFINPPDGRPVHSDFGGMRRSFEAGLAGAPPSDEAPYVPLLLRHVECPGFTGPAMTLPAWLALCRETFRLQFPAAHQPPRPGP